MLIYEHQEKKFIIIEWVESLTPDKLQHEKVALVASLNYGTIGWARVNDLKLKRIVPNFEWIVPQG